MDCPPSVNIYFQLFKFRSWHFEVFCQIVLGQINHFFSKYPQFLHNLQVQKLLTFILLEKYFELFKCVLSANTALLLVKCHRKHLSVWSICFCEELSIIQKVELVEVLFSCLQRRDFYIIFQVKIKQ